MSHGIVIRYILPHAGRNEILSYALHQSRRNLHAGRIFTQSRRYHIPSVSSRATTVCKCNNLPSLANCCHGYKSRTYVTSQDEAIDATSYQETSALYVRHGDARNAAIVDIDLDLEKVFGDAQGLRDNIERRKLGGTVDVNQLVSKYAAFSAASAEHKKLEDERESVTQQMKDLIKQKKKDPDSKKQKTYLISRGKEVREKIKAMQSNLWDLEADVTLAALQLPNALLLSTPDEDEVISEFAEIPDPCHKLSYKDIVLNWLSYSPLCPSSYFMHGPLASAELEMVDVVSQALRQAGLTQFSCPDMTKAIITEGCGGDLTDPKTVLTLQLKAGDLEAHRARGGDQDKVDKWDIILNLCGGAALPSFAGFLCKMNIAASCLPQKWFSVGRHYKPVSSSTVGLDTGLLNTMQSTQVSMFGLAKDVEQAEELFQEFMYSLWDLYSTFGIHMRLVKVGAPGLRRAESFSTQIEAWLPSEKRYIKVAELGMYSDFISRRLMVKCSDDINDIYNGHFPHMIYGTALKFPTLLPVTLETGIETILKLSLQKYKK